MSTAYLVPVYLAYTIASVLLTIWLARTLSTHGQVFLDDVFVESPRMSQAVNRLLVVGFYLLNLGYAFLTLESGTLPEGPVAAIEILARKLGALLLALGAMHFANIFLFYRVRRRTQIRLAPPPVKPQLQHA